MGVITGLKALKRRCRVTIVSDSQYVVDAAEKGWLENWQKRNWRTSDKKRVKNIDLWKQLCELLSAHEVNFKWVRGHNGNRENERCDQLAVEAYAQKELLEDTGFEVNEMPSDQNLFL